MSICIPKKVMTVDGGDRFSTLVITPRQSQRTSMLLKVERQVGDEGGPAIRKSSN